jgi:hypothetical protein
MDPDFIGLDKMKPFLISALAVVLSASAVPAGAALNLDQFSVPETGVIAQFDISAVLPFPPPPVTGQTFTVGQEGILSRIDLGVFGNRFTAVPSVLFSLRDSSDTVLFTQTLTSAQLPLMQIGSTDWSSIPSIDLAGAGIQVHPGEAMSFTVFPTTNAQFRAGILFGADGVNFDYAGGTLFQDFGTFVLRDNLDLAFRTYVESPTVAGVPEPAGWALLIVGVGLAGSALRYRRRAELLGA